MAIALLFSSNIPSLALKVNWLTCVSIMMKVEGATMKLMIHDIKTTSTRIIIEDLPLTVHEIWLEKRLIKYGEVDGMIVRYPSPPKRPFAFIDFATATAATTAIHSLNTNGYDGVKVIARISQSQNGYDRVTITPHRVALQALPSSMTQREVFEWIECEGKSDVTHVDVDGCGNGIAYFITHTAMKDAIRALDHSILNGHPVRIFPETVHTTQSILTTSIANSGSQVPSSCASQSTSVTTRASEQRLIKQEPRERGRSRSLSRDRSPYSSRRRSRRNRSRSRSRSRSPSYSKRYHRR